MSQQLQSPETLSGQEHMVSEEHFIPVSDLFSQEQIYI